MRREEKHMAVLSRTAFRHHLMCHMYLQHTSLIPLQNTRISHKNNSTSCSQPHHSRFRCFLFTHRMQTFPATRPENEQQLPPPLPSRPVPPGPRRGHELGSFGHLRNARDRGRCCIPRSRRRARCRGSATPSAPRDPPPPRSSLPRSLPPRREAAVRPPTAGSAPAPRRDSPARRPPAKPGAVSRWGKLLPCQAVPGSQHGRGKAAGAPAGKAFARKVSFSLSLPPRPAPAAEAPSPRRRPAPRCSPSPLRSGCRPAAPPPGRRQPLTAAVIHPAAGDGLRDTARRAGSPPSWAEPGGGKR